MMHLCSIGICYDCWYCMLIRVAYRSSQWIFKKKQNKVNWIAVVTVYKKMFTNGASTAVVKIIICFQ